jgi:casein kinase 1
MDSIVAKDYKLSKKLGSGAFGEVFMALNVKNHTEYAVKLEKSSTKSPQLFYEAKILGGLQDDSTVDTGFPNVYYVGSEGEYNVMVMDLCGKSLEDLFNVSGKKYDLKTTLMVGYQMLERIEYVHKRKFIHRDVKPDNFVTGYGKKSGKIYMIDFGLAKKYELKDSSHIPYKDNKNLTGTARFASLNTHLGIEQGRRDDIEGIANVLLYFVKGSVPWQNLKANTKKEKY